MRLQELVHEIDLGRGPRLLRGLIGVLLLAMLTAWYDQREFRNFSAPEAMETAQLARNLAEGRGFTTHCLRPLSLQLLLDRPGADAAELARKPVPDLNTPPLYPLLLAGFMKVAPFHFGASGGPLAYQPERLIGMFNQALFFLALLATAGLARKLFDPLVGALTAILLAGSDMLWQFSLSGLPTMLLLLLFVSLVWCLVNLEAASSGPHPSGVRTAGWAAAAGVVLGLGALTMYAFVWLALPVLGFVGFCVKRQVWLPLTLIVLLLAAALGPWMARNYQLSGTLFGVPGFAPHQETSVYPDNRLERSFKPAVSGIESREYLGKFFINAGEIVRNDLLKLGGSWIAAFFLPGLFVSFRNPTISRLRYFTVACLGVLLVAQALGRTHLTTDTPEFNSENLLVLLTPLVVLFGVALYSVLLDQWALPIPELRYAAHAVFVAIACLPLLFTLLQPRTSPLAYPPYYPPYIRQVAEHFEPDELIMSDMPWAVAWYGNRPCIWVPLRIGKSDSALASSAAESFYAVHREFKPVAGLFLTPLTTNAAFTSQILQDRPENAWPRFAASVLLANRQEVPDKFPLLQVWRRFLSSGHLLLADRARWEKAKPQLAPAPANVPALRLGPN